MKNKIEKAKNKIDLSVSQKDDKALTAKEIYNKITKLERYIGKVNQKISQYQGQLDRIRTLDEKEEKNMLKGLSMLKNKFKK
jgi:hypothetical protein